MNQFNQSSGAATKIPQTRMLAVKRALVAAAAVIATSALALMLGNNIPLAVAETAQTVQTPYGAAPISFADLVAKVSPAVVSINVKGDAKVADNDLQIPGMPDIPEDSPLYDFFKHFRQGQPNGGGGGGPPSRTRRWRRARASSSRPTASSSPTITSSRTPRTSR